MTASNLRNYLTLIVLGALLVIPTSSVHARSYHYPSIVITADVREDSTVAIEEKLTYKFDGTYHQGYRAIPHKALGAITDVQVYDVESGMPLEYVSTLGDINDPTSWGTYTYYESNGETNVEWNFEESDSEHTWSLRYVVHGAIGFYKEYDEFYWNLFTDYDVPVDSVVAIVRASGAVTTPRSAFYSDPNLILKESRAGDDTFVYETQDAPAGADVTVAAGWQKGLVDQRAYWLDFIKLNALYFYALLIALAAIVYTIIYEWRWRQAVHGKGTIIAQYEPPENLQPAEAEMIVKGYATDKAWAASIVDLAVRGYVTIKAEEPKRAWGSIFVAFIFGCLAVFGVLFTLISFTSIEGEVLNILRIALPLLLFFLAFLFFRLIIGSLWKLAQSGGANFFTIQDYTVTRTVKSDADLEEYEQKYLEALMEGGKFETAVMRKSQSKGQEMYQKMQTVKKTLQDGMQEETSAYARPPGGLVGGITDEKFRNMKLTWKGVLIVILIVSSPALIPIFLAVNPVEGLGWMAGAVGFAALLVSYVWYWKVRLNTRGEVLKEEWLGFKLYLETAEKYRLQNLTPETFEKYLPYAIIFGVEKEWGKAFASISMPQPSWYSGASAAGIATSGGGFSPAAFSSAFSASFASSVSSSGGGGSGGGGGAGGGGGGGGGGAR